jgi:DNA repair protein RecO (recombination protein O)
LTNEIEGIVVGAVDLGEADRILRLLTPTEGRTSVVARGARSSRRRFAGTGELGTRVHVVRSMRRDLPSATAIERMDGPNRARSELERIGLLAYACEICAALSPEGSSAEKLYQLLVSFLAALEADPRPDTASRIALEGKALTFAGLAPALVRCVTCGEPLTDPATFDPEAGGARHARCGAGRPVPVHGLACLEELRRTPLADTPDRPVPGDVRWLLSDFVQYQLGRPLASRTWLASLG